MHTASDFTVLTPPPARQPRVLVLRPGFEGPSARYCIPATQSEHEITGRVAEALGVAGFEVTAWLAACPGLGEIIDGYLTERGADADEQAHERALEAR